VIRVATVVEKHSVEGATSVETSSLTERLLRPSVPSWRRRFRALRAITSVPPVHLTNGNGTDHSHTGSFGAIVLMLFVTCGADISGVALAQTARRVAAWG
jgi:hypothetical protein